MDIRTDICHDQICEEISRILAVVSLGKEASDVIGKLVAESPADGGSKIKAATRTTRLCWSLADYFYPQAARSLS